MLRCYVWLQHCQRANQKRIAASCYGEKHNYCELRNKHSLNAERCKHGGWYTTLFVFYVRIAFRRMYLRQLCTVFRSVYHMFYKMLFRKVFIVNKFANFKKILNNGGKHDKICLNYIIWTINLCVGCFLK